MDRAYCTNVLCINCRHRTYTSRLTNMAACYSLVCKSLDMLKWLSIHRLYSSSNWANGGNPAAILVSLNLFERWRPY
ncbi:hypothetical protein HOLleu_14104 [Holothuria leucospilota]|uniref:Uncharacterized protein n=1 Tax=Holothuria leucospilota TaxID=206669 RepID=A0A9Q1C733_HOLLE|nr:hypothetical protein HOLleu_14104 [Holothuria leucospilota]